MNFFIDLPTFSRFYALNNHEEDEKPPPDLKSTEDRDEGRKIKTGKRRINKQTSAETKERAPPPSDDVDTMGSVLRKEKSSWSDWQFWKRSESSSAGHFGAFRKSNKAATGKDIDDAARANQPGVPNAEHASDVVNMKQDGRKEGGNVQEAEPKVRGRVEESELNGGEDDPLVSYKNESNGSKHVMINMEKVETIRKNNEVLQKPGGTMPPSNRKVEQPKDQVKNQLRNIVMEASASPRCPPAKVDKTCTSKPTDEVEKANVVKNGFVQFRAQLPKKGPKSAGSCSRKILNATGQRVPAQQSSETQKPPPASKLTQNSDEKPHGKQQRNPDDPPKSKESPAGCFKPIKNNAIPLPRLNANEVARTKSPVQPKASAVQAAQAKDAGLEQGKLHNVMKTKVTDNTEPSNDETACSSPAAHIFSAPVSVQAKVPAKSPCRKAPGSAKAANKQPELIKPGPTFVEQRISIAARKHARLSENQAAKFNGVLPGKARASVALKMAAAAKLRAAQKSTRALSAKGRYEVLNDADLYSKPPRRPIMKPPTKPPITMKDASTATPSPRAKVDAEVQVPCEDDGQSEILDASDVAISIVEETESLLRRRPWDTERVLKMQVLLDDRQVEVGQLEAAARAQLEELTTTRHRCEELEEVVDQANMEGKPQLVIQINELTEMKTELLLEVSRLTVDIERERTSVKALKTELVEVKGQLNAARKKNWTCQ